MGRVLDMGAIPHNAWAPAGELLLDGDDDTSAAARALVEGLRELPWSLLRFEMVPVDAPHWRAFRAALADAGVPHDTRRVCDVGMVDIVGGWSDYRLQWSKSHRRNVTRDAKQLGRQGGLDFQLRTSFEEDGLEPLLREGFQVEDRSWKGRAGTSALKTPGMFEFYVDQARLLARAGQLCVAFLQLDGRMIAFKYGLSAKGTVHLLKSGYDESFSRFSPGQVLTLRLLDRLFGDPDYDHVDFMGPISADMASWRPRRYAVGRLAIARPGFVGRALMHAYRRWWPVLRRN